MVANPFTIAATVGLNPTVSRHFCRSRAVTYTFAYRDVVQLGKHLLSERPALNAMLLLNLVAVGAIKRIG